MNTHARQAMRQSTNPTWRPWTIGVTAVLGVLTLNETQWVIDPLVYSDVRYLEGYQTSAVIHIVSADGRIYRLPKRLWAVPHDGPVLAERLRNQQTAAVHVSGGEKAFWFG